MEPFDFDKFIKGKVLEEGNIHSIESNTARSGIWIDIQDKLRKGRFITWYHLAAAILLLIVGFSIIMFRIQGHYNNENQQLMVKLELLERNYTARTNSLAQKEEQIKFLTSNLNNLESKIVNLSERETVVPIIKTIYQKDTVFVNTIEYVTYFPEENLSEDLEGNVYSETKLEPNKNTAFLNSNLIIYPSPSPKSNGKVSEPEKMKISFGNYIAREN